MDNCHLGECVRHHHRYQGSDQITKDDAWTRKLNGDAASQKQAYSDSSSDGDHRELPGIQPALQFSEFLGRSGGTRISMRRKTG
jgi:hypothetical protein